MAEKIWRNVVSKPIERSMQVAGSYRDLDTLINDLKKTHEEPRLIRAGFFDSLLADDDASQCTAEGQE